jgi:hypothetical protein
MLSARRKELARLLGFVDQMLALAEEMIAAPQDCEDLETAEELLLECQAVRRQVEAELSWS